MIFAMNYTNVRQRHEEFAMSRRKKNKMVSSHQTSESVSI